MRKWANKLIWLGLILIILNIVLSHIEGPSGSRVHKTLGLPNIYKVKVEKYQESGRESELTEDDFLKAYPPTTFLTIITDIFLYRWMLDIASGLIIIGWLLKLSKRIP